MNDYCFYRCNLHRPRRPSRLHFHNNVVRPHISGVGGGGGNASRDHCTINRPSCAPHNRPDGFVGNAHKRTPTAAARAAKNGKHPKQNALTSVTAGRSRRSISLVCPLQQQARIPCKTSEKKSRARLCVFGYMCVLKAHNIVRKKFIDRVQKFVCSST